MNQWEEQLSYASTLEDELVAVLEIVGQRVIDSARAVTETGFLIDAASFHETCDGLLAVASAIAILHGTAEVPKEVQARLLFLIDELKAVSTKEKQS